jgi:hypothetical protein
MCEQCIELEMRIDQCNRLMNQPLDPLTIERMTALLSDLARQKSQMHPIRAFGQYP